MQSLLLRKSLTVVRQNFTMFTGKKKAYTALLQCRTFLCRKKWGPQRKDFGGGYGLPGFCRVFVSTTGLESFSLRPEKFSKRFSFGGGRVRFLLRHVYMKQGAVLIPKRMEISRESRCLRGAWLQRETSGSNSGCWDSEHSGEILMDVRQFKTPK